MFKRTSRGAALAASASLAFLIAIGTAKANVTWGGGGELVASAETTSLAASRAFNQPAPIVINENGSIPLTTNTTQFAACLVNNANGSQRVVLMLRYLDGSVYTIVSSDTKLADFAASKTATINLTGTFYFATQAGQKVVRQTVYVNGAPSYIQWGSSPAIVNAFTKLDGTCRNVTWGGGGVLAESGNSSM